MQEATQRAIRRLWPVALIAGMAVGVFWHTRAQSAGEEVQVLAADTALGEAMRSGDRTAARKLLSLQFTYDDENGKLQERKVFLADLKGTAAEPSTDAKVAIYGLVAMVTGTHKSALGNDTVFIDVWAKQKGAWRALTVQNVMPSAGGPAADPTAKAEPQSGECKNPCQTIPYRVRSPAEQDVIGAFQDISKALIGHDAEAWGKHVAEDFRLYRSGQAPATRTERMAAIEGQKSAGMPIALSEIATMRLAVYGDGAAMIAMHGAIGEARPAFRATRVWVKRNGQWLLAISVQTDVKATP